MKINRMSKAMLVVLGMSLGVAAFAKNKRYEVQLTEPVQASGVQLKPGAYNVEVDGNSLVFYRGRNEVAKVAVRSEEEQKKIDATAVTVAQNQLKSIELAGTKTRLIVESK